MNIPCPALRGDDALGFLAAIGLLSLSEHGEIPQLRLAWQVRAAAPAAVLEADVGSVAEFHSALTDAYNRLVERNAVLPGVPAEIPLKKQGTRGSDPMRMPRAEMAALFDAADASWNRGDKWYARWLVALCAQAATKREAEIDLTPFYAPTGQMSMRNSMFEKTMQAVKQVEGPTDALTGWKRTTYDGANFDERAKRDAAVTTHGKADNQGAPSPTWLAAMAMRFFPIVDDGNQTAVVGWHRVRLYPGYTRRSLIWPTWSTPLDPPATRRLLEHPALGIDTNDNNVVMQNPSRLGALGITGVYGASRSTLTQGDGPLGPAIRIWPTAP